MNSLTLLFTALCMASAAMLHAGTVTPATSEGRSSGSEESHRSPHSPPFGFSLTELWWDPWPHSHFSRRGTPFVHLFSLEPAFLDRDFFLDAVFINHDDGKELSVGAELEWAFTRRLGLVLEIPYTFLNPERGAGLNGVGDLAVAPRFLLVETERWLLALNTEIEFPTGRDTAGLSAGEVVFAPSLSAWVDLGGWVTAAAQIGVERGIETEETELFYRAALMWSFRGPALVRPSHEHARGHEHSAHYPPGMLSLTAELDARMPLNGEDEQISTGEVTLGVTYSVTDSVDVRAGYVFPVMEPKELRDGWIFSVVYHF